MTTAFTVICFAATAASLALAALAMPRLRIPNAPWSSRRILLPAAAGYCVLNAATPSYIGIVTQADPGIDPDPVLMMVFLFQAITGAVGSVVVPRMLRRRTSLDPSGVEQLRRQAFIDPLTGLHNRRYVDDRMSAAMRDRLPDQPLAVMLIDVDDFKEVNDELGHEGGDRVLQSISMAIAATLRSSDIVGRFGGDEFVAVLPDADFTRAVQLAERVRDRVREIGGGAIAQPSVSIGLASFPEHGMTPGDLLRSADMAMYESKRAGRDRVSVATPTPTVAERLATQQPPLLGSGGRSADLDHSLDASASGGRHS